MTSSSI